MRVERRQIVLCVALVGTLLAVALVESPDSEEDVMAVPTRVTTADRKQNAPSEGEPAVGQLQRRDLPNLSADPFRPKSWYVAPPQPSEPAAPPLPFSYLGMLEDRRKATVYLARNDEVFAIAVGERFADSYRLEKIERGMLIINYLPLSVRQTLPTGISE